MTIIVHKNFQYRPSLVCMYVCMYFVYIYMYVSMYVFVCIYGTAQFKLDYTCVQQLHDSTRFCKYTQKSLRVHEKTVVKMHVKCSRVHTRR